MGCITNKHSSPYSNLDSIFKSFEENLGFSKLSVIKIDRVLHRYSKHSVMNQGQIIKAFSELKLPFSQFERFYDNFKQESGYRLKKLCTLGIILGNANYVERLKTLFQNYDSDISGSLSIIEIKELIQDIIEIFCIYLPEFILLNHTFNSEIEEYVKMMKDIKRFVVSVIVDAMMQGKSELVLNQFILGYKVQEEVSFITNIQKLRTYCLSTWEKLIKPIQKAVQTLDTIPNLDKISFSDSRRRKSKNIQRLNTKS